eukprot:TRINITY_DN731_c0_g3_i1.p1 TRINITY_DN731_c0_g3~~TRINITY_DN731_c0_g3_i1.p1  ORF type:complete len:646 (-),score=107.63 TRINITY_DN731_c0_g3_i1:4357-6294(-)
MNAAPIGPSSMKPADEILSQPESQHGKYVRNAVLTRPSGELQPYLKQAVTELSGWGRATAASFLPDSMPLIEQSVDLQSSLQQRLIEQNPVIITPLFLRLFDVHASNEADNPFVNAKPVTHCALATGVHPTLPFKVELGLEEAPPKQKAQPFVSTVTARRALQGPSINDTFSLGRTVLTPALDRSSNKPVVVRNSVPHFARRKRNVGTTRRLSKMRINDEDPSDVEENDLEEVPEKPEGLTEQQWIAQRKKDSKKKDIGKVLSQIKELKRRQEHRAQEKYRPIEESEDEDVVRANDTFYERSKRRQEREQKKKEHADEALRKKQDALRLRRENKKKRIEKRLKRAKKRGHDDTTDDDGDDEEVVRVDSDQEETPNGHATRTREETDQQTDAQGSKRQRIDVHGEVGHGNNDPAHQSQQNLRRSEMHPGRHEYGYLLQNQGGGYRPSDLHMDSRQQYQNVTYPSHHPSDRQMFDDRGSHQRPAYPPGPYHGHRGPQESYYDSRLPQDDPFDHSRMEPNLRRNPDFPPNVPPQRQYENGHGMDYNRPPPHPMEYPFQANDALFRPPVPSSRDYHGYPPQYSDYGNTYYHQDQHSRPYPEANYGHQSRQRGPDGQMRNERNSPPPQYRNAVPFRPPQEYHQSDPSYRR